MRREPPKFKEYFHFTRRERNSAIVIVFVCVFITTAPSLYKRYFCKSKPFEFENNGFSEAVVDSILAARSIGIHEPRVVDEEMLKSGTVDPKETSGAPEVRYRLDVNKASSTELQSLKGIGPVLGDRIVKYRESLGGFRSIMDLTEIYGLSSETYQRIAGQLHITNPRPIEIKKNVILDINTATATDLAKLDGIGPVLSARIVKYRDAKIGYDSINELKKIYGLNPQTFNSILPNLRISTPIRPIRHSAQELQKEPRKEAKREEYPAKPIDLDINKATSEELQEIRGIGPFYSRNIVEFRDRLGGLHSLDQLQNVFGMKPDVFELLRQSVRIKSDHDQFDINQISFKNLLRMGILEYEEVKYIFQLKKAQDGIHSEEQIRRLKGIPKEKLDILMPYINFVD